MDDMISEHLNEIWFADYLRVLSYIPDSSVNVVFSETPYEYDLVNWKSEWRCSFQLDEWIRLSLRKINSDGMFMVFDTWDNIKNTIKPIVESFKDISHKYRVLDIVDCSNYYSTSDSDIDTEKHFLLIAINEISSKNEKREKKWQSNKELLSMYSSINPLNEVWGFKSIKVNDSRPNFKSIRFLSEIINVTTDTNDIILDSLCGIGSIAIASYYTCRDFIAFAQDSYNYNYAQKEYGYVRNNVPRTVFLTLEDLDSGINGKLTKWNNRLLNSESKFTNATTANNSINDIYLAVIKLFSQFNYYKLSREDERDLISLVGNTYFTYNDYRLIGKMSVKRDLIPTHVLKDELEHLFVGLVDIDGIERGSKRVSGSRYVKKDGTGIPNIVRNSEIQVSKAGNVLFVKELNGNNKHYKMTTAVKSLREFNEYPSVRNDIQSPFYIESNRSDANEIIVQNSTPNLTTFLTYKKLNNIDYLNYISSHNILRDKFGHALKYEDIFNYYYVFKGWKIVSEFRNRKQKLVSTKLKRRDINFSIQTGSKTGDKVSLLDLRNYERYIVKSGVTKRKLVSHETMATTYYELVLRTFLQEISFNKRQKVIESYVQLIKDGKYDKRQEIPIVTAINNVSKRLTQGEKLEIHSMSKVIKDLHITTKRAEDYDLWFFYIYTLTDGTKYKLLKGIKPKTIYQVKRENTLRALEMGREIKGYFDEAKHEGKEVTFQDIANKTHLTRRVLSDKYKKYVLSEYKKRKRSMDTDAKLNKFAESMYVTRNKLNKWIQNK